MSVNVAGVLEVTLVAFGRLYTDDAGELAKPGRQSPSQWLMESVFSAFPREAPFGYARSLSCMELAKRQNSQGAFRNAGTL